MSIGKGAMMTPCNQMVQVLDLNGDLEYSDHQLDNLGVDVKAGLEEAIDKGYVVKSERTYDENTIHTFSITDEGKQHMEKLRNP